jgi:hypothetical protein
LQAQVQQQQAQNALAQEQQRAQEQQFTAQQAQQLGEFGTTSGQNAAELYAQIYHTLPGYNQYGMYTGQTGTYPATAGTPAATRTPSWIQSYHSGWSPGGF